MARTVFVLGAGASRDFGAAGQMPVGSELADRIRALVTRELSAAEAEDPPGPLVRAMIQAGKAPNFNQMLDALSVIRNNIHLKSSIDDLVNEWSSDKPLVASVAKFAIALEILKGEAGTRLNLARESNAADRIYELRDSWLGIVTRRIQPDAERRNLASVFADAAFVTFNYDRCIEQFLLLVHQSAGSLDRHSARQAVSRIPVLHVYGTLGNILADERAVPFGFDKSFAEAAQGIKTYTEEVESAHASLVRNTLASASKIVFLGFGFHDRNLDILFGPYKPSARLFASGFGLRPRDTARINDRLGAAVYWDGSMSGPALMGFGDDVFED